MFLYMHKSILFFRNSFRLTFGKIDMHKTFVLSTLLYPLYPIHSDTECLDTASGLKNKQDTYMVSAFNDILWRLSTTFSYGKYARYF